MATEEASLIEALTSGTAFQPQNDEDFSEVGLIRLNIEAEKLTRCATNRYRYVLCLNFAKVEGYFFYSS